MKSCSTLTAPPSNFMIAIRSAGVICVLMNFCAAVKRAELVGHGHRAHVEVDREQAAVAVI